MALKTLEMKNLRKSRTLMSLERASIDVAVALLTTATFDECKLLFSIRLADSGLTTVYERCPEGFKF